MLFLLAMLQRPAFDFDVQSGAGLTIAVDGVPFVTGSWFQYYETGFSKSYYSSKWTSQSIKRVDADTIDMSFVGGDNHATGTQRFRREGSTLTATYRFEWSEPSPVHIEVCTGQIWAPALTGGVGSADGKPVQFAKSIASKQISDRQLAPAATGYSFQTRFADLKVNSTIPQIIFDARFGYPQEWAEQAPTLWAGVLDGGVSKEHPLEFTVTWQVTPHATKASKPTVIEPAATPLTAAIQPSEALPVLIPKPKDNRLHFDRPTPFTSNVKFPAGRFMRFDTFFAASQRRFQIPPAVKDTPVLAMDGGVSNMEMKPGGYRIEIRDGAVSFFGQDDEGLRSAAYRLAQLIYVNKGHLVLPTGVLVDEPSATFRGAHMFVGNESLVFQRKLWERVLRPLGMNKVVLECERTRWDALGATAPPEFMSKSDLATLFTMYRTMEVEPIPLIQSWGHMDWLFDGGKNLDLAFNRLQPYAIDPRKPAAKEIVAKIWNEAVELLQPKSIHFGLDEVDMIGHAVHDPELITTLWREHLPFLGAIAKKHQVRMMMWGDKALAPGEAPDAALGDNRYEAEQRRAAIPKGAIIADWHYKDDPRPASFYPTIQLWKREGHPSIAASWYRPNNIRGHSLAGLLEGTGTLQTTWPGYFSNEQTLTRAFEQYTAMVLAADYSWSERQDDVKALGYDPAQVFREMFYAEPRPSSAIKGFSYGTARNDGVADDIVVDDVAFRICAEPIARLHSVLAEVDLPERIQIKLAGHPDHIWALASTDFPSKPGDAIADVTLFFTDGTQASSSLTYGTDVRCATDHLPTERTPQDRDRVRSRLTFMAPPGKAISAISFVATSRSAGLSISAITGAILRDTVKKR